MATEIPKTMKAIRVSIARISLVASGVLGGHGRTDVHDGDAAGRWRERWLQAC
jgi:hypothetical protein